VRVTVARDEPVFAGHFPGFPVLPGVYVIDHVHRAALAELPGAARLAAIERCRFLRPVLPGDDLDIEVSLEPAEGGLRCVASVGTGAGAAARMVLRYETETDR
jgi:3-hydroxyacyl-[acyl-carrier-protein] dehydratase